MKEASERWERRKGDVAQATLAGAAEHVYKKGKRKRREGESEMERRARRTWHCWGTDVIQGERRSSVIFARGIFLHCVRLRHARIRAGKRNCKFRIIIYVSATNNRARWNNPPPDSPASIEPNFSAQLNPRRKGRRSETERRRKVSPLGRDFEEGENPPPPPCSLSGTGVVRQPSPTRPPPLPLLGRKCGNSGQLRATRFFLSDGTERAVKRHVPVIFDTKYRTGVVLRACPIKPFLSCTPTG